MALDTLGFLGFDSSLATTMDGKLRCPSEAELTSTALQLLV